MKVIAARVKVAHLTANPYALRSAQPYASVEVVTQRARIPPDGDVLEEILDAGTGLPSTNVSVLPTNAHGHRVRGPSAVGWSVPGRA